MKIHELRLSAVGPFTGLTLDLSGGQLGFHLIYGPNEAGKSSTLRAIRYLLFGFPPRLSDDFRHPYAGLRVGATIRTDQAEELCFTRRKAAHKSLRDGNDDAEVDEALLGRCLGHAGEDLFLRCFGIDHATLVAGGQEIVRGEGELGRLLFSGSGVAHLRELDSQLEREARELFAPQAQKPTINRLLRDLREARKQVRDHQLRPLEWERHYNALRDALRRKEQLEVERDEKRRQRDRLQRFHTALPAIAEYLDVTAERERLGDATLLPQDFNLRREAALRELGIAQSRCESVVQEIRQREEALAQIEVDESVLAHGEGLLAMEKNVHRYEDSQADRPVVEVDLRVFQRQAVAELRKLGEDLQLEQAPALILPTPERVRIQQLAAEYAPLLKDVNDSQRSVEQLEAEAVELAQQLAALAAPQDPQPLSRLLGEVRTHGAAEVEWEETRQVLQREEHEAECELRRLPGWSGTLNDLETTPVPVWETVERFGDEMRDAEEAVRSLDRQRDDLRRVCEDQQQNLDELQAHQEVPTESQLRDLRHRRDRVWRTLRGHWRERILRDTEPDGGELPELPAGGLPLDEAFEQLVAAADTLSDRLRHEADRVARHAQLQAECARASGKFRQLEQQRGQRQEAYDRLQDQWCQLWQAIGVEPLSPREMRAWLSQHASILDRVRKIRELSHRQQTLFESIGRQKLRLTAAITGTGASQPGDDTSLVGLIHIAQQTLDWLQDTTGQRRELTRDLERCRKRRQECVRIQTAAEGRLAEWRTQWQAAVARLPRGSSDSPAVANQVLEILHELSLKLASAEQQRGRLQEIDDFSRQFEQQVRELARQAAPDLPLTVPVGGLAATLLERHRRAVECDKERRRLNTELLDRRARLEQAHATVRQQQLQLEQLCRDASCLSPDELLAAWELSERRRQLDEACHRLRGQLRELCGASPLEMFMNEAGSEDAGELPLRIAQLDQQIQQLDDQLVNEVGQAIGREEGSLKQMDGSGLAAEAEETARDIVASLSALAEQYARLRIAQAALRHGVDRYRSRHQGPILQAAGELFSRLTDGAFQGLKVDYDAEGKPTVTGVRAANDELVQVSGMSDGTADQLYLALRCAWLANYLDSHESLPFIVDDILLRFDDQRAAQTLRVLGDLSTRTQVLFFTHHRHLVDFAQHHLPAHVLFVHQLTRN